MRLIQGDLWATTAPLILVTTNAYINQQGELVMGRGAAKEASVKWPGLAKRMGAEITRMRTSCTCGAALHNIVPAHRFQYDIILPPDHQECPVGIFQVKYHFKDMADLKLIESSAAMLACLIEDEAIDRVAMNFPGIGWGGLREKDVMPIIEQLPDCVEVHKK